MRHPARDDDAFHPADAVAVRAVERAFRVLEAVADGPIGVSELARATALHKATVHRLLQAMVQLGYVEHAPDGMHYQIGLRVLRLRDLALSRLDLRSAARTDLEALRDATRLTVHVGILSDGEMVVVEKLNPASAIQMASFVGARNPLHSSAQGKAVLALFPPPELEAFLGRAVLFARTANTITSPVRLRTNLEHIRVVGYAVDDVENEEGIRCVGAALRDHTGRPIGAISVTGALSQVPVDQIHDLGVLVARTARRISGALGYLPPKTERRTGG